MPFFAWRGIFFGGLHGTMITVLLLFVLLEVEADDLLVSTTTGQVRGFWKDTA
jgi:hypothetical protein